MDVLDAGFWALLREPTPNAVKAHHHSPASPFLRWGGRFSLKKNVEF